MRTTKKVSTEYKLKGKRRESKYVTPKIINKTQNKAVKEEMRGTKKYYMWNTSSKIVVKCFSSVNYFN